MSEGPTSDAVGGPSSNESSLAGGTRLPMFPLGSVLLPGMLLPLRVFEPRYQQLTADVLAGDGCFGVVMIERGSEVGGGDVRAEVGCVARVLQAEELGGGRWGLLCVGTERLRVRSWLEDDPYPLAVVDPWPDEERDDDPALDAVDRAAFADVTARFERVRELAARLGVPGAEESVELMPDPELATFQIALSSPLGPLDRHRLLSAPSWPGRVRLLAEQLDDVAVLLEARLDGR